MCRQRRKSRNKNVWNENTHTRAVSNAITTKSTEFQLENSTNKMFFAMSYFFSTSSLVCWSSWFFYSFSVRSLLTVLLLSDCCCCCYCSKKCLSCIEQLRWIQMYHTSFSAELNGCAHERGKRNARIYKYTTICIYTLLETNICKITINKKKRCLKRGIRVCVCFTYIVECCNIEIFVAPWCIQIHIHTYIWIDDNEQWQASKATNWKFQYKMNWTKTKLIVFFFASIEIRRMKLRRILT